MQQDAWGSEKSSGELVWRGVSLSCCLCCHGGCGYCDAEGCAASSLPVVLVLALGLWSLVFLLVKDGLVRIVKGCVDGKTEEGDLGTG